MEDHNSLDVYTSLFISLYRDIASCCSEVRESRLDELKILKRVSAEGISFFTKSLPAFGKAFDKALSNDTPLSVPGLKTNPGSVIPKLFGWLLRRVFTNEGKVRSDADPTSVLHARQLFYFLYKVELPYSSDIEQSVLDGFVSVEQELAKLEFDPSVDMVLRRASELIGRVLCNIDPWDIVPGHGPGSVATGESVCEKHNFGRVYTTLDEMYPFTEYFMLGTTHVADDLTWLQNLPSSKYPTAKVVLVPKDSRGPRLISAEPLEVQWIQQGLKKRLYDVIENHRLTRGHVNFTDQTINRDLALSSSHTGKYVTLDMKDASDRVSLKLVSRLFCKTALLPALLATRSVRTRLPDGKVVELAKFAPMGSALCFPVEAICFFALAVAALVVRDNRSWARALDSVYVYGDDIICRTEDYGTIMSVFPFFGLMFNERKCCVSGLFRESCGCDAFNGVDVTPIRLRKTWCPRSRDGSQLRSYVELSNALYARGYYGCSTYVETIVDDLYGPQPIALECDFPDSKGKLPYDIICYYRPHLSGKSENSIRRIRVRYNPHLQRREYQGFIVRPALEKVKAGGWRELLRSLTGSGRLLPQAIRPDSAQTDDSIYALPRRSCLKRGWGYIG